MKKRMILIIICLVLTLIFTTSCRRNEPELETPQTPPTVDNAEGNNVVVEIPKPAEMIIDPEEWKEKYPLIYASYLKTSTMGDGIAEDSALGGSHPIDYLKKYPNIAILYEGVGFAKEYYEARGHYYALEDVINISRPKSGASCFSCKIGEYERLHAVYGDDLFAMDFQEISQDVEFGITCYSCHRNTPGEGVQTTSLHFNNAVPNLETAPKPGTQACAQCHVEYYFDKETNAVVLPWSNGTDIGQIESYYDEMGYSDWVHPRTGTPLIKVQHPETEMYASSIHDSMKVTCADCHMPRVTENGEEYKSHWVTSPLKTPNESCGKCHSNNLDEIVTAVGSIQKETEQMEVQVSDMLVKLTKDFAKAIEDKKLDDQTIDELRSLHRKAQYRWDFVFVENSTGFHNKEKAQNALEEAKTYTQEALDILSGLK